MLWGGGGRCGRTVLRFSGLVLRSLCPQGLTHHKLGGRGKLNNNWSQLEFRFCALYEKDVLHPGQEPSAGQGADLEGGQKDHPDKSPERRNRFFVNKIIVDKI